MIKHLPNTTAGRTSTGLQHHFEASESPHRHKPRVSDKCTPEKNPTKISSSITYITRTPGPRAVRGRWHSQCSVRAVRNAQDTAPGDTWGKPGSLRGAGEVGVTMHSLGGPQTRQECI